MSYDQFQQRSATGTDVDVGLQDYMRGVFNTMSVGLGLTGVVAYAVANIPALAHLFLTKPLIYVAIFAPMIFLWMGFRPGRVMNVSADKLRTTFLVFSGAMGLSFASIFFAFSGASIARAFFITAGTFAGMSIYGYTTKRDLTKAASFLVMGLIGIFLASIANMFMHSSAVHFAVSVIGVLVFTGLTAFDIQRLKETYSSGGGEQNAKLAVMGALNLYLNFINLFQIILSFMGGGDRR